MSVFLYYIPEQPTEVTLETAAGLGIGYAFEVKPDTRTVNGGPDGGNGIVFGNFALMGDLPSGYYPDKQTWRQMPKSEVWIGYYTGTPPAPEDLIVKQPLAGHWVELGDGREWMAPVARGLSVDGDDIRQETRVPVMTGLDDDGNWTASEVSAKYAALWDTACSFWDHFAAAIGDAEEGEESAEFKFDGAHTSALLALSTNYRIGKVESVMLGLFSIHHVRKILEALIDWPVAEDWLKKKAKTGVAGS